MLARPELSEESVTILEAVDYIKEHGWCQDYTIDSYGRVCIMGALTMVRDSDSFDPASPICAKIRMHLNDAITTWNDKPGRTQQEVIERLTEIAYTP